jgi:hypothetical protein
LVPIINIFAKMSISYALKLSSLKKTNIDDLNDVIIQTNWVKIGTDEDGNTGSFPGSSQFDLDTLDPDDFISYEDLTEEIVLEWIQSSIGESYDAHANMIISQQIDEKTSRVVEVIGQFPWTPEPVETIITEPVETIITEPLETIITEPVETIITEPLETIITEPLETIITEPLETIITEPVETIITEPLETIITEPLETIITEPVETIITEPVIEELTSTDATLPEEISETPTSEVEQL